MTINQHAMEWWENWIHEEAGSITLFEEYIPIALVDSGFSDPIVFPVSHAWDAYQKMFSTTKGELAELRLKGFEYDCALPKAWIPQDSCYDNIRSRHVWLYDGKVPIYGRPFDLLADEEPVPIGSKAATLKRLSGKKGIPSMIDVPLPKRDL